MKVIETTDLTKKFGQVTAADQISISVSEGEIYGFLGLNGAGKTTLIRLLLGLIKPDTGSCRLFGETPVQSSGLWARVGYLIETPYSYPNLSVYENLQVVAKLRGINDPSVIRDSIDRLRLGHFAHVKEKHLSLGNKQRLGLAKALFHRPKLLILDEPINGLDPEGIVEVRALLKDLAVNHGTTIFLSSHILSEIAKLATRIGIIHRGKLISEFLAKELDALTIRKLMIATPHADSALEILRTQGLAPAIEDGRIALHETRAIDRSEWIAEILTVNKVALKELYIVEEDLESYFLRVIHEYIHENLD